MGDERVHGVGVVRIPVTGETIGQYGYEVTVQPGLVLPSALEVDIPVAVGVQCMSAALSLELELEDGQRLVFVVTAIGASAAEVKVIGLRAAADH